MLLAALQEIVHTSLSGKEHGDPKPDDENNEFVFAESEDSSRQFCEDNSERCKVRDGVKLLIQNFHFSRTKSVINII